MAFLACDEDGTECIYEELPIRHPKCWDSMFDYVFLPSGSIAKLIGRELTWEDDPYELK